MPHVPDIFPPNSFMVVTSFCGMFDAPCNTNGNPGRRCATSAKISKRNSSLSDLRLYAPWLVPIAIAKESMPVAFTNFSTSSGLV